MNGRSYETEREIFHKSHEKEELEKTDKLFAKVDESFQVEEENERHHHFEKSVQNLQGILETTLKDAHFQFVKRRVRFFVRGEELSILSDQLGSDNKALAERMSGCGQKER